MLSHLKSRHLVHQHTPGLSLDKPLSFYLGIDPTHSSLHIGHLLPLTLARHLISAGHTCHIVIGTATGSIGDPTGRNTTRPHLSSGDIADNAESIKQFITHFFDGKANIFYNKWFYRDFDVIDFIQATSVISLSRILSLEAISSRLEVSAPITLAETLYPVLQASDFLYLLDNHDVTLQIGGSDQWGNMILATHMTSATLHCLTTPLLLDASGAKIGKSQGTPIYLSPSHTSPWDFYQFWRSIPDPLVSKYLLQFTNHDPSLIDVMVKENVNAAKEVLAESLTLLVHGTGIPEIPTKEVPKSIFSHPDPLPHLLVAASLAPSLTRARNLIADGGVSFDGTTLKVGKKQLRIIIN